MVDDRAAGMRLDIFLASQRSLMGTSGAKLSRSEIQRLIVEGQITLNGAKVKASARIKAEDRIEIVLIPPRDAKVRGENLPLEILYEDPDCIVINKAPGMTVHPAAGHSEGTLVNAILYHCADIEGIGGERRPGIVHRLDKDTSGVMVVAKTSLAYQSLVQQFKERSVEKLYLALVWGRVAAQNGVIDRPIGRHRSDRKKMSSRHVTNHARQASTEWSVKERFVLESEHAGTQHLTLLEVRPRSGRTHQIRVHLADAGFPLVGDRLYGRKRKSEKVKSFHQPFLEAFSRQALHAEKLVFIHARTGRRIEFAAPLAGDMAELLRRLREIDSTQAGD
ncbi:MAG: RluA family pseudouridine synthase [Chloroflexota bacterium]